MPPVVILTRENDRSTQQITARGFRPLTAPMLRITHNPMPPPPPVQAILVTSGNALPSLTPGTLPVLAVGDATAERARARGFTEIHSAGRDARALAELTGRLLAPGDGPLLLATGARQGRALAEDLRARGFRVHRRVCYTSHPVSRFPEDAARALAAGEVRAVLFLSAETASVFVRLMPHAYRDALASVSALAIGRNAAVVLEALPWRRICRAENPTLDDVLALI